MVWYVCTRLQIPVRVCKGRRSWRSRRGKGCRRKRTASWAEVEKDEPDRQKCCPAPPRHPPVTIPHYSMEDFLHHSPTHPRERCRRRRSFLPRWAARRRRRPREEFDVEHHRHPERLRKQSPPFLFRVRRRASHRPLHLPHNSQIHQLRLSLQKAPLSLSQLMRVPLPNDLFPPQQTHVNVSLHQDLQSTSGLQQRRPRMSNQLDNWRRLLPHQRLRIRESATHHPPKNLLNPSRQNE